MANYSNADLIEATGIVQRVTPWIMAASSVKTSDAAVSFRFEINDIIAHASGYLEDGTLTIRVLVVMAAARLLGATLNSMGEVRQAAESENAVSLLAQLIRFMFIVMALTQESVIVANMTFRSRDDAGVAQAAMMAEFDNAAELAADALQADPYMKIITLQARVSKLFADLHRTLPRIVNYQFAKTFPVTVIAQKLYQDPSRAQEIIDENHIVHPAFAPMSIKALSV